MHGDLRALSQAPPGLGPPGPSGSQVPTRGRSPHCPTHTSFLPGHGLHRAGGCDHRTQQAPAGLRLLSEVKWRSVINALHEAVVAAIKPFPYLRLHVLASLPVTSDLIASVSLFSCESGEIRSAGLVRGPH